MSIMSSSMDLGEHVDEVQFLLREQKVADITEENLEDLLAYDDLFLDYFNDFLSLPVFPKPLYYDRLTATFQEVNDPQPPPSTLQSHYDEPLYGATDEERDHMLLWAKQQRLPLFLRSELFREFKLCKLLLRPLEDRISSSRHGSALRGYSRQTESYVSSLSNSADNSAADDLEDEDPMGNWGDLHHSALYRYQRPGSNAYSLPPRLSLARMSTFSASSDTQTITSNELLGPRAPFSANSKIMEVKKENTVMETDGTESETEVEDPCLGPESPSSPAKSTEPLTRSVTIPSIEDQKSMKSSLKSGKDRSRSSKSKTMRWAEDAEEGKDMEQDTDLERNALTGSARLQRPPTVNDFDAVFGEDEPIVQEGEAFVSFADDGISLAQTETDVKGLEVRHQMTLQQLKEFLLGSRLGMTQFGDFMVDTAGIHLYHFWLDCEFFKDVMGDFNEEELLASRNQLFRDIQDKYKMSLTADAKKQILKTSSSADLSHTVFLRAQYDVLRRLRVYWLPRFLIHKERMDELRVELQKEMAAYKQSLALNREPSSFLPSICLVNSMPVQPEHAMQIAKTTSWEAVSKGGRRLDDRIKSAKIALPKFSSTISLQGKFLGAMMSDKAAGGPFRTFLERSKDRSLLSKLMFWEDVTEYGLAEDRSADRLLRMVQAWSIYNHYLSPDAKFNIGVLPEERDTLHTRLLTARDYLEASLFSGVKQVVVDELEKTWIRFLQEDMKTYLECHLQPDEDPPESAEEIEVRVDELSRLVVRQPARWVQKYPPSTASERGLRLRNALSVAESYDEALVAEQRKRAREKRAETEKERQKTLKAARKQQREKKHGKNVSFTPKSGSVNGSAKASERGAVAEGGEQGERMDRLLEQEENLEGQEAEEEAPEKSPSFLESVTNKSVVGLFKKYLMENETRDVLNIVNMYLDIEAFSGIGSEKAGKQKKETQAHFIHKTYMEQGARKKVLLSDKVYNRLKTDKDRPKSSTLKEAQHHVLPQIEENFKRFWNLQAEELGVDSKQLASMSKAELALRSDNDLSMLSSWKKRNRAGKDPKNHTQLPSGGTNKSESQKQAHFNPIDPYSAPCPIAQQIMQKRKSKMYYRVFSPNSAPQFKTFLGNTPEMYFELSEASKSLSSLNLKGDHYLKLLNEPTKQKKRLQHNVFHAKAISSTNSELYSEAQEARINKPTKNAEGNLKLPRESVLVQPLGGDLMHNESSIKQPKFSSSQQIDTENLTYKSVTATTEKILISDKHSSSDELVNSTFIKTESQIKEKPVSANETDIVVKKCQEVPQTDKNLEKEFPHHETLKKGKTLNKMPKEKSTDSQTDERKDNPNSLFDRNVHVKDSLSSNSNTNSKIPFDNKRSEQGLNQHFPEEPKRKKTSLPSGPSSYSKGIYAQRKSKPHHGDKVKEYVEQMQEGVSLNSAAGIEDFRTNSMTKSSTDFYKKGYQRKSVMDERLMEENAAPPGYNSNLTDSYPKHIEQNINNKERTRSTFGSKFPLGRNLNNVYSYLKSRPDPGSVLMTPYRTYREYSMCLSSRTSSGCSGSDQTDGRAQPSREDKATFLSELDMAAAGKLPLRMLYFYKYLAKHGKDDGCPYVCNDLFFYWEVQKFKDACHAFTDEEMLKRKVQSLLDVYIDSTTSPSLQIDIPSEQQQKAVRAAQRLLSGKDVGTTIFDEAQFSVFKELLPYWAGFMKSYKPPENENKRPLTKQQRERVKRLQEFENWRPPSAKTFKLPSIPRGATVAAFSFTLTEGVRWREGGPVDLMRGSPDSSMVRSRMNSVQESLPGRRSRRTSLVSSSLHAAPPLRG